MRAPNTQLLPRAQRLVKRIAHHACPMLAFVGPDGVLDSCPADSERATALMQKGAAAGYAVVGVFGPAASAEQIASDARGAIK